MKRAALLVALAACGGGGDAGDDGGDIDYAAWTTSRSGSLHVTFDVATGAAIADSVETLDVVGSTTFGETFDDPDNVLLEFGVAGDLDYRKVTIVPSSSDSGVVLDGFFGNYLHPSDAQVTTVTIYPTSGTATAAPDGPSFSFAGTFTAQQGLDVATGTVSVTFP